MRERAFSLILASLRGFCLFDTKIQTVGISVKRNRSNALSLLAHTRVVRNMNNVG
jgi:hypothetical protein